MILLPGDVLEALVALRRSDGTARLAATAAAAVHLGQPLVAPVPVATRRPASGLPPRLLRAEASAPAHRSDLRVEGVRLPDLESAVAALAASEAPEAPELIAALVRHGSTLEGRAVDAQRLARLAAQRGDRVTAARVAWWCFRMGAAPAATTAPAAAGWVSLAPGGARDAPRVARFGLVVNTADGLGDADGSAARVLAEAVATRPHVADLAALFESGLALSPRCLSTPAGRALRRLARYGYVTAEGALLRPRAPFDGACALLAARVTATARRALLGEVARRLRDPDDADEAAAAMLACLRLDRGAHALTLATRRPLAEAAPSALWRLVASLDTPQQQNLARAAPGVFERLGLWDDLARFVSADLTRARGAARGGALVAAATLAWRRDRVGEAEAYLTRAAAESATSAADRFEAALLRATLDAEAGAFDRAAETLHGTLARARAADDARGEARALHRLGTLDARRGRLREALAHYNAALARCPRDARALRGVLLSNSAAIQLWTGRPDAAEALARSAWEVREAVGAPSEKVATRVLAARIDEARGLPAPPGGRMLTLAWEAERSGSLRLAAEVWLDAAGELAATGRHDAARDAVDRARHMLVQIAGAEPALAGLVDEADSERRLARGDAQGALGPARRAVTALTRLGAVFYATRARRALASVRLALGDERGALRDITRVARACDAGELALGATSAHAAVYALAAVAGDEATRRHAERALAYVEAPGFAQALARGAPAGLAERFEARPRGARAAARALVAGQARDLDALTLARLCDGAAGAVVVDLRDATLRVPGRPVVSLLRRRLLAPLLVALARAPAAGVTVDALGAAVWRRRASASTRTAVKVAVSRLRALLGAHGPSLVPARIGGAAAYRWSAARTPLVVVLEDVARDAAPPDRLP